MIFMISRQQQHLFFSKKKLYRIYFYFKKTIFSSSKKKETDPTDQNDPNDPNDPKTTIVPTVPTVQIDPNEPNVNNNNNNTQTTIIPSHPRNANVVHRDKTVVHEHRAAAANEVIEANEDPDNKETVHKVAADNVVDRAVVNAVIKVVNHE